MRKKVNETVVEFEGMGTRAEADLYFNGLNICTIGSNNPQTNEITIAIVKLAANHIDKEMAKRLKKRKAQSGK